MSAARNVARQGREGSSGIEHIHTGSGRQVSESPAGRRGREAREVRHRCAASRPQLVARLQELPAQILPCIQAREEGTRVHCQV